MDENSLVRALRDRLAPRYREVLVHKNLPSIPAFTQASHDAFGYVPVLNEIDMIFIRHEGHMCAVEVKCLQVSDGSMSRPFYDGVGQALSLLRYGFDYVALWHLFVGDMEDGRRDRYGAGTWWFLRNQIGLPLEFTYFKVDGEADNPVFVVMQYLGPNQAADILPIDHPQFAITWKNPNPLRYDPHARTLRRLLADALGVGKHVAD